MITETTSVKDLDRLRRHPGKRTPAEAVSRRIFFHGLEAQERLQRLIVPELEEALRSCLGKLPTGVRKALPTASGLLDPQIPDDRTGMGYLRSSRAGEKTLTRFPVKVSSPRVAIRSTPRIALCFVQMEYFSPLL